jgi:hypothetical protein
MPRSFFCELFSYVECNAALNWHSTDEKKRGSCFMHQFYGSKRASNRCLFFGSFLFIPRFHAKHDRFVDAEQQLHKEQV